MSRLRRTSAPRTAMLLWYVAFVSYRSRARWATVTLGCLLSCARFGYDFPELPGAVGLDGASGVTPSDVGVSGADAANAAAAGSGAATGAGGEAGASPSGGAGGSSSPSSGDDASSGAGAGSAATAGSSGGAADSGDAGGTSGASGGGGTSGTSACTGATPLQLWSFDADLEGWTSIYANGASGTLRWSGATGNPTAGALQFDATSGNGLIGDILYQLPAAIDLSGRTLSAWVMLDSGSSASVHFIAATTLTSTAFGADADLSPGAWTCVSFDPNAPDSAQAGYAPTSIRWIGLQPSGNAPLRIYVDEVAY